MKEYIFKNGIKLIYEYTPSNLTSVSISLEAGASCNEKILGVAHATEHMVYKGTKNRNEKEINLALSEIFGFTNAMTNYPYVVYYGTCLKEDTSSALDLFSDILINPLFKEEGFKEEMTTIKEELSQWDEDIEQFCEDKLFFNCYEENRLKYPIIGTFKELEKITLEDIKDFYNTYYSPKNTVIAVSTSMEFNEIKDLVDKHFTVWQGEEVKLIPCRELPKEEEFIIYKEGINSSRVEIIAPISSLSSKECSAFKIFNEYFGVGVDSRLFTLLRTENALVYDVITSVSCEKHIGLYKIIFSISNENLYKGLELIKEEIKSISTYEKLLTSEKISGLYKGLKRRELFREEQRVRLTNRLCIEAIMFNKGFEEEEASCQEIIEVGQKVLSKLTIGIVLPKEE